MPENWNTSGLIIEGVPATGKTTLLKALQQDTRFTGKAYPSSFILSEHQTQRLLENTERTRQLTTADSLALLDHHLSYVESLATGLGTMPWKDDGRTNMRLPFIFERFHLTHACHYGHTDWNDFTDIDQRLTVLNCKIVLVTMDRGDMQERIISSRSEGWYGYISRFGDTDERILDHYQRQQDDFIRCASRSSMETCIINTSESDCPTAVDTAIDFWNIT